MAASACPIGLALEGRRAEAEVALLEADGAGDAAEAFCVRAALSVAAREGEALVGGVDSPTVLQLVAARSMAGSGASEGEEGVDVLVALLAPGEDEAPEAPPVVLLDARGAAGLELVRRYWRERPEYPLVVRRGEGFAPARLADDDGTAAPGPMNLARARALASGGADRLRIAVPSGACGR